MKILAGVSFLLIFGVLSTLAQEGDAKAEELKGLEVVAIHELELLPGVDAADFEAFMVEVIVPIYNKMEGQELIIAKGDRGVRTGLYAFILTFDSVADRDRIYPPSGEMVGDFGEKAVWDKFMSMAKGLGKTHTDYVNIAN